MAIDDVNDSRRTQPLRVLIAEDSEDDALLLLRQLRRGGFRAAHHRVESARGLRAALDAQEWDLILTDFNMPQFSPADVVAGVRERDLDIPIILVSAHLADVHAADAMKEGVNDYVLKDNLSRLVPAVERELREADTRRAYRYTSAQLEYTVLHDTLTGLANRKQIEQRLDAALDAVDERGHAFLAIDIDQFHVLNDTGGYAAGDELVRRLADILGGYVHESDTLARIGPDEFGLLLERCPLSSAWRTAERLRQAVGEFRLDYRERSFQVTVSIGLVPVTGSDESGVADVLRRADLACRAAKDLGANRIRVYSVEDQDLARRFGDMAWVARLREGLDDEEFVLFCQPVKPLQDEDAGTHAELLLRLGEPDGRLVPPDRFIPAAERFDLMPMIDRRVVRESFRAIAASPARGEISRWFINLSGRSLSDEALPAYVRGELNRFGIEPRQVCFEVTETAAISNMNAALRFMHQVRALGCRVALDDFGSGLSSFTYLKSLPADYLKIDGSFVRGMLSADLDYTIVQAIARIGHSAGMRIIAEKVESMEVLGALRDLGIDRAQGWALGTPERFYSSGGQ